MILLHLSLNLAISFFIFFLIYRAFRRVKFILFAFPLIGFANTFLFSFFTIYNFPLPLFYPLVYFYLYSFIYIIIYYLSLKLPEKIRKDWRLFSFLLLFTIYTLQQSKYLKPFLKIVKTPFISISGVEVSIASLIVAFLVFYLTVYLGRILRNFIAEKLPQVTNADVATSNTIATTIFYTLIIVAGLASLSILGIDLTTLKILGGALGIGIGFGLQQIVNNFVSGFIVLWERSVRPGDVIEIDGMRGIVERIGLRSTIIKTIDNIEVIIPNAEFITGRVINLTLGEPIVRIEVKVSVAYRENPEEVRKILLEAAKIEGVVSYPEPYVFFDDMGDSGLIFSLTVWTHPYRRREISSELRFRIFKLFRENNIEIPYPQLDVHIKDDGGIEPGKELAGG